MSKHQNSAAADPLVAKVTKTPTHILEKKAAKYQTERPQKIAYQIEWNKSNQDKVRAARDRWRRANPEYVRNATRNRDAKRRGGEGKHTKADIRTLAELQQFKCAGCSTSIRDGFHGDHITPLVLGGSNRISNIQLLCATCNLTKNAKDPIEWAQQIGRLL